MQSYVKLVVSVDKRHKPPALWRRALGNSFMAMYYNLFIIEACLSFPFFETFFLFLFSTLCLCELTF
jgi:hypothetical protein